jgi:hypothetical protein
VSDVAVGLSILSTIAGGAMVFVARVWAEGFDIGKETRTRFWLLYVIGATLLGGGLVGLFLTTHGFPDIPAWFATIWPREAAAQA